jgi:NodT family efflux transporter outer membrane factor (OMF) lipoprotein
MAKKMFFRQPGQAVAPFAALVLIVSGCTTVGPDFTPPTAKLQPGWNGTSANDLHDQPIMSNAAYWASFHDETLVQLIALANKNNPTLESASQAINQAKSTLGVDFGSSLPAANLTGSSQYQQPTAASVMASEAPPSLQKLLTGVSDEAVTQQFMGQLSWEIDFWGKWRRTIESDKANIAMAQAALAAAKTSLEASVASAYCTVRMLEKRIDVAKANLAEQAENLRIAEARYRLGATSELDYRQAQTQYEQTNSQLPNLQITLEQNQHALSILLGETPNYFISHFPAGNGLPAVPESLPLGTPSDLLRRRPDVLQAEYAAAAQSARIGLAETALYPSFTLNGAVGYSTTNGINNLFKWDSRAAAYGIGFNLPIFDRGRLKEQVKVQDSLFAQTVLAYQNQVIKAQQDVEDSLSAIAGNNRQLEDLQRADKAAARTSVLAQLQYKAGQVDYTTVSSAVQAHLQTSDSVVQIEGGVLQASISTFRALGGGWTQDTLPSNSTETGSAK